MGLFNGHYIIAPPERDDRINRALRILDGLNFGNWFGEDNESPDELSAVTEIWRESVPILKPETFIIFNVGEVTEWYHNKLTCDDVDKPGYVEIKLSDDDSSLFQLIRYSLGDENIPDEILTKIIESYDATVKTAMKLGRSARSYVNEMIKVTFHENSRKILDKYYSKSGFEGKVDLIGSVAFIPDIPNAKQVTLFVRSTMMNAHFIFVKAAGSDFHVLLTVNEPCKEDDPSDCIEFLDNKESDAIKAIAAVTGVDGGEPFNLGRCALYAVYSLEDAKKLAQGIDDYIVTGKKNITMDLVYNPEANQFTTKDGNFNVNFNKSFRINENDNEEYDHEEEI